MQGLELDTEEGKADQGSLLLHSSSKARDWTVRGLRSRSQPGRMEETTLGERAASKQDHQEWGRGLASL